MAVTKAVFEILLRRCPVEDRVRLERVSQDAKIAVDDSWRHKHSLTRSDEGWLKVPASRRCDIISKMTSLKVLDIAWAVNRVNYVDREMIVQEIIKSCPIIRQIYEDSFYKSNLQVRYLEHYGAACKLNMLDAYGVPISKLKSLKLSHPSLNILWLNDGITVPEETTHLVHLRSRVSILASCDPTRLTLLQSIEIQKEIRVEQFDHICTNFPKLKSFTFFTSAATHTVNQYLMQLECLEDLNYTCGGLILGTILNYLTSKQGSNLKTLIMEPCAFSASDLITIIPTHLSRLETIRIGTGAGIVLSYTKESLQITWSKESLTSVLQAFPKSDSFLIKTPERIHAYWTTQFKSFASRRKNKLIKVIFEQKTSSTVEMEEEFDNLLVIV